MFFTEQSSEDPGDIELNFGSSAQLVDAASGEMPGDPLASSNVFGEPDEQQGHAAEAGWHSAPNLHLGQNDPSESTATTGSQPAPALFTSPLMDRTPDSSAAPATDQTVVMFPTFGEAARQVDPVWNFGPAEAATSAPEALFLSSSQQFSLGTPADESSDVPERPMFSFGTPAGSSGFAPPAATPSAEASAPTITLPGTVTDELVLSSSQQFSLGAIAATLAAVDVGISGSTNLSEAHHNETQAGSTVLATPTVSETAAAYAEFAAASRQKFLVMLLLVVGSYASAITIVLIYVLTFGRAHQLESLPDLAPPMQKGVIGWLSIQPKHDVAASHVLKLGQSQRFGNVRVTPVKVTRGPLAFQHYANDKAMVRSPTEPLLKLWLKFENVSSGQTFTPLDRVLLFRRKYNGGLSGQVFSYGFLCRQQDRAAGKSLIRVYDMPVESEYQLVGAADDRPLGPGESCEQFVPSEEGVEDLKGDLVWRVHFRKGYHPTSLRGVTTLIDVQFNSGDISNES